MVQDIIELVLRAIDDGVHSLEVMLKTFNDFGCTFC